MSRIHKDLSLAQKLEIPDKIKLQPLGCSTRRLSEILGIPKSTIARIQLQEQLLREQALSQVTTRKRKREGEDSDVDETLTQWFTLATSRGVQVSGSILKAKSEDLARKLEKIEDNLLEPQSTAIDISKKINILQAIQFDSWRDVSSQTIRNCFRKCGFSEENHTIDQQLEPNSEEYDIVRVLNNVEF
ncbi:hypothetical protein QTP88_009050 [Uroleucon formosanum]